MPSVIAYASENQSWGPGGRKSTQDVIGFEVQPGMVCYTWWKLDLAKDARQTEYDDPLLLSAVGKGIGRLPKGKTAEDVAADFLRLFRQIVMKDIASKIGEKLLNSTPIEFRATVPAIWPDKAQHHTESAYRRAGFYDRKIDKVKFVSEPEAAAVSTLKRYSNQPVTSVKVMI